MDETIKFLSKLAQLIGSLILFYLLVVFVGGVVQIAEAADRIYLGLGQPIFFVLVLLLVGLVLSPLYIYFKFPKALIPPEKDFGPEHEQYMLQLRKRLISNPKHGIAINNDADVKLALAVLSKETDQVIRKTAGAVFIGTAIMQNGKLDGLISLVTQVKMVWAIACIYQQRPSPRQMIYLYSNVAVSALLAESIEDIDLYEVISPLLSSAGFSALGAIPGASLVINSIASGTSNAFLTIRVGCIAKQYCEATSQLNKSDVRKSATLAAAKMVGSVVKENSGKILSESMKVALNGVKFAAGKVGESVVQGAQAVGNVAGEAINGVKAATSKTLDVAKQGAQAVGGVAGDTVNGVKVATSKTLDVAKQGAQAVGNVTGSAVEAAKNATGKVSGSVVSGAQSVKIGMGAAVDSTTGFVKSLAGRKE